jgi:hypothetical protein
LGRFVSRDSGGYHDGMSLYAGYFIPIGVDPWGYFSVSVVVNTQIKYGDINSLGFASASGMTATYTATCEIKKCTQKKKDDCEKGCYGDGIITVTVPIIISSKYGNPSYSGGSFNCDTGRPGDGPNSVPMDENFTKSHESEHANQYQQKIDSFAKKIGEKCPIECRKKVTEDHLKTCISNFKADLKAAFAKGKSDAEAASNGIPKSGDGYWGHIMESGANRAACISKGKVPGW